MTSSSALLHFTMTRYNKTRGEWERRVYPFSFTLSPIIICRTHRHVNRTYVGIAALEIHGIASLTHTNRTDYT